MDLYWFKLIFWHLELIGLLTIFESFLMSVELNWRWYAWLLFCSDKNHIAQYQLEILLATYCIYITCASPQLESVSIRCLYVNWTQVTNQQVFCFCFLIQKVLNSRLGTFSLKLIPIEIWFASDFRSFSRHVLFWEENRFVLFLGACNKKKTR